MLLLNTKLKRRNETSQAASAIESLYKPIESLDKPPLRSVCTPCSLILLPESVQVSPASARIIPVHPKTRYEKTLNTGNRPLAQVRAQPPAQVRQRGAQVRVAAAAIMLQTKSQTS